MDWCDNNGVGYIFGFPGNSVLDANAEAADQLRFWHASIAREIALLQALWYKAGSWSAPRRVIARIEASMHPDPRRPGQTRQEIDVRYVVTSLEGDPEQLYEGVYCQRGQMENLIKLHKAQLASDRIVPFGNRQSGAPEPAHGGVLADAHRARRDLRRPFARQSRVQYNPTAPVEDRRPRHRAHEPHPRASAVELPLSAPCPCHCVWPFAVRLTRGACAPNEPPTWQINPKRVARRVSPHHPGRATAMPVRLRGAQLRSVVHDPG